MNKVLLFLLMTIGLFSCDFKKRDKMSDDVAKLKEKTANDTTTVFVIDTQYNFGTAKDGEKVEFHYRFKNTGTKPLWINSTSASCGCTVPEKPELPIYPGDTGSIKVVFNTSGRVGMAHKTVTVISNAKPDFPELLLTGEVVK